MTPSSAAPALGGVLETALYVDDLPRAVDFYRRVFGLPTLYADDRLCAFDVAGRQVLLLFLRGSSTRGVATPGGRIPPHDGAGPLHMAFAVAATDVDQWLARFDAEGVPLESRVRWARGGTSLYVRDPDGHLIELATPGLWATY